MQLDTGRLWYVPALPAVELLTGCYQRQVFPWHAHAGYCLSLQERGSKTLALPGVPPQRVEPGQVLVLNPGQVHADYAHAPGQPWQLRSFYLTPAWLEAVAPTGAEAPNFPQPLLDDPSLFATLRRAHQLLEQDGYSPATAAALVQALAQLVRQYAQPALPLTPAPNWPTLVSELADPLAVSALAARAGLSRFQFTRAVAQATGLPPRAHRTQ